jgi:serine/threonine protein phosphatase PrpC
VNEHEENKDPIDAHDQNSNGSSQQNKNHSITFRQRRLSVNKTKASNKSIETNVQDAMRNINPNDDDADSSEMLSSEIDDQELTQSEKERNRLKRYTVARRDTVGHMTLPISPDKVGTFSCHGVEPHPYIIYSDHEVSTNIQTKNFLQKIFGGDPEERRSYTSAKIVTITERKINQDRGHVICPYADGDQTALFAAYDGHGENGELLAEHTMNALSEKLCNHPHYSQSPGDFYIVFVVVFCEIDRELLVMEHLSPHNSGTTACVALLEGQNLWIANVGDSRAVLGRRINRVIVDRDSGMTSGATHEAVELTKDHKPTDAQERDRVLEAGGFITIPRNDQKGMPARIWLDENCSEIGLAMSRSVGDHALKGVGVIAEPAVQHYHVGRNDEFFIIATDGVWEFISSSEAVNIVQSCFNKGMGASEACKELIKISMKKWEEEEGHYRDDITAIVVKLDSFWD